MSSRDDTDAIVCFLRDCLGAAGARAEASLFDELGIDSMQMLELVAFVESRFSVTVKAEMLTRDNFATPACIARFCHTLSASVAS